MQQFTTPSISIFSKDMVLQTVIKNITSLTLTRNFYYSGSFGFDMPYSSSILAFLENDDNFLVFDDGNIGIVSDVNASETQQNGIKESFRLQGETGLSLLRNRIVVPSAESEYDTITDNVETVLKHYINNNLISAADSNRNIDNLELETDTRLGSEIYYQMRYDNLYDELCTLAEAYNLGHNIYFDKTEKKLKYGVFEGKDRSQGQSINERVYFSKELGNISEQGYTVSKKGTKNHGIIGGSGTGVSRVINEVGTETGWNRKEIFIDASSYASDKLEDYGTEQLTKYKKSISLPVSIISRAGTSTEYKTKWDLGDIVTVISEKYNKTLDLRITELTENYNADGFELTATLGDTETTISDALKRKFEEFEKLKTA